MGMILRIASSRIVGQGDIVGRCGFEGKLLLSMIINLMVLSVFH